MNRPAPRLGIVVGPIASLLIVAGLWPAAAFGKVTDMGTWSQAANLLTGRESHTATLLRDGRVLVVGGRNGAGHELSSAEICDPKPPAFERRSADRGRQC